MGWSNIMSVIIIGAGIGGLTTAAYLSKMGIESILFEKTGSIGGRCSTRIINGEKYEIGAIYVGGGAFDNLRNTFGVEIESTPVKGCVKLGEHFISFPMGFKTLSELRACGVKWAEIFSFIIKNKTILSNPNTFKKYESVGILLHKLTNNKIILQFLSSLFGMSGISPSLLPSLYMDIKNPIVKYKSLNPEYLKGGNGEVASILKGIAENKCTLLKNEEVKKIIIENNEVKGVETCNGIYESRFVVSNTGIKSTFLELIDPPDCPDDYQREIEMLPETLKVVNIFFTFPKSFSLPKGYSVFFLCSHIEDAFNDLEEGLFPRELMFILHIPSNLETDSSEHHRATLQFYYPKNKCEELRYYVDRIMNEGLDSLFCGFSKAVDNYTVYNPDKYLKEFGFNPYVFGVSPNLNFNRFPVKTKINNLFCVGDSVLPEGPCVPQAMESGIICAKSIYNIWKT